MTFSEYARQVKDYSSAFVNEIVGGVYVLHSPSEMAASIERFCQDYSDVPALFGEEIFKTPQKMVRGSLEIGSRMAQEWEIIVDTYQGSLSTLRDFSQNTLKPALVNWGSQVSALASGVAAVSAIPHASGVFGASGAYYMTGDGGESGGGGASGGWDIREKVPKYPQNLVLPLFPPEIILPRQGRIIPPVTPAMPGGCASRRLPKIGNIAEIHFLGGSPARINILWFSNVSRIEYFPQGTSSTISRTYYPYNDSFLPSAIVHQFVEIFGGAWLQISFENLQRFSRLVYPSMYYEIVGGGFYDGVNLITQEEIHCFCPENFPAECLSIPDWPLTHWGIQGNSTFSVSGYSWQETFLLSCATFESLGSVEIMPVAVVSGIIPLLDIPVVGVPNYVNRQS